MNYNFKHTANRPAALSATLLASLLSATAGPPDASRSISSTNESTLDALWARAVLYRDDANPILQEFKLRGRYQGQYHQVDSRQGDSDGWEDRRSRFGFDAKLFEKKIEVRADFQSNDGFEDFYAGLVDAYIRWKPNSSFTLTAGKLKPLVGYYDFLQSTNEQPTFERSQIFNQLNVDRVTGITAEGKAGDFSWHSGLYSNDIDNEFGQFDADVAFSLGGAYKFAKQVGLEKAEVRIDWLHSERDPATNVLARYDDIVSATLWFKDTAWSLVAEAYLATGGTGTDEDVFGGFIQGTYDIIPKKLQAVARYSHTSGDGPSSVRRQTRYESFAVNGRGDSYDALYLGAQYFIHGDKLKLLGGVEYSKLDGGPPARDFEGFTYFSGVRLSF